jgi:chromate reductase
MWRIRTCAPGVTSSLTTTPTLVRIPLLNAALDDPGPVVTAWRKRIGRSEAVLIAAPEYAGALAGTVKNALDWIVGSGELYAKPVAVMSAG